MSMLDRLPANPGELCVLHIRHWLGERCRPGRKHQRPRLTLAFAVVFLATAPLRAADPDLAEIARRLQDWRHSFENIEVTYHAWNREHLEARFPEVKHIGELDGEYYRGNLLIWTDKGQIWCEQWRYEEGLSVYANHRGKIVGVFEPLYLLWWNNSRSEDQWLGDVLARGDGAKLLRYEMREGVRCAVVEVERRWEKPKFTRVMELWLDTEHDFLPRWYERDGTVENPNLKQQPLQSLRIFRVVEFKKLKNGRWFPWRGYLKSVGDDDPGTEWFVKEVKLNQEFPPGRFDPPPQGSRAREDESILAQLPVSTWWRLIGFVVACTVLFGGCLCLRMRYAKGRAAQQLGATPETFDQRALHDGDV